MMGCVECYDGHSGHPYTPIEKWDDLWTAAKVIPSISLREKIKEGIMREQNDGADAERVFVAAVRTESDRILFVALTID
jgi:hypothetical protein